MLKKTVPKHYKVPIARTVFIFHSPVEPSALTPNLLYTKLCGHTLVFTNDHIVSERTQSGEFIIQAHISLPIVQDCPPLEAVLQFRLNSRTPVPGESGFGVRFATTVTSVFPVHFPSHCDERSALEAVVACQRFDMFKAPHSFALSPRQRHRDFDHVLLAGQNPSTMALLNGVLRETLQSYPSPYSGPPSSSSRSLTAKSLLICGPHGSGPCSLVSAAVAEFDDRLSCLVLSANAIYARGKKKAHKVLREVFALAVALRPCVLVLDDLQKLVPRSRNGQRERVAEGEKPRNEDVIDNVVCTLGMFLTRLFSAQTNGQTMPAGGLCVVGCCSDIEQMDAPIAAQFAVSLSLNKISARERDALCTAVDALPLSLPLSMTEIVPLLPASETGFAWGTLRAVFDDFSLSPSERVRQRVARHFGAETETDRQREKENKFRQVCCDILMHRQIECFRKVLVWPQRYRHLYEALGIRQASTNILLYGPPGKRMRVCVCVMILTINPIGCGKSLLPSLWVSLFQLNFVAPRIHELVHGAIGESEKSVKAFFATAKLQSPCVLFVDEFDAVFCPGSDAQTDNSSLVSAMLAAMDDLNDWNALTDAKVYVIAATRSPWKLDSRFLTVSRFGSLLKLGPLDRETRQRWRETVREREKWDTVDAFTDADKQWLHGEADKCIMVCDAIHFQKETRYFADTGMSPLAEREKLKDKRAMGQRFNGPTEKTDEQIEQLMAPYEEFTSRHKGGTLFE